MWRSLDRERVERSSEEGQTIVLFALMATVLMGVVALTVDVGQIYVAHRSLQNTVDLAALAGAERLPGDPTGAGGVARASVVVNSPTAVAQVRVPAAGRADGIEVEATQEVVHLLAGVFGRISPTVRATAVAIHRPSNARGNAIVVLGTGDTALQMSGTGQSLVTIGNVRSNGGVCAGQAGAIDVQNGLVESVSGVQGGSPCTAENVAASGYVVAPGPIQDPLRDTVPPPPCPCGAGLQPADGWKDFPAATGAPGEWVTVRPDFYRDINVPSGRRYRFLPGVYFVRGDVLLQGRAVGVGSESESADDAFALSEPSTGHPWGGVTFYLMGGNSRFDLNASAEVKLAAYHERILVWLVDGSRNPGGVTLSGGGNSRLFGTVYAPQAHVQVSGNYGGTSLVEGQVVADTLTTTGTAATSVSYNEDFATPWRSVSILVR